MTRKRKSENEISASPAAPARRPTAPRTRAKRPATSLENPAATLQAELEDVAVAEPQPEIATPLGTPLHDDIARLAYTYWADRGFQGGTPEEDWLRAETELKTRASAATA